MHIILNSMLIWLSIIPIAFLNGGLREVVLLPRLNNVAYIISGLLLIISIFIVSFIFIPRLGTANKVDYLVMGVVWAICTVAFEFIVGAIRKVPIREMLQSYNPFTGNLWLFVVVFIILFHILLRQSESYTK